MLSYFIPTKTIPLYPSPFHLFASSTSSLPSESTLRPCSFAQHIIQSAAQHIFVFVFEVVFEAPAAHTCHFFRPLLQMLWVGFIISLNKSHSPLDSRQVLFYFSLFFLSCSSTNCVFIIMKPPPTLIHLSLSLFCFTFLSELMPWSENARCSTKTKYFWRSGKFSADWEVKVNKLSQELLTQYVIVCI